MFLYLTLIVDRQRELRDEGRSCRSEVPGQGPEGRSEGRVGYVGADEAGWDGDNRFGLIGYEEGIVAGKMISSTKIRRGEE